MTVGNALAPFDRLLGWVDEAVYPLEGPVEGLCQHGSSRIRPRRLDAQELLPRAIFDAEIARADVVICHAGVGALWSALRFGHTPLVAPRRGALGEHVNDHQLEIVEALSMEGRVRQVNSAAELAVWLGRYSRGELSRGKPGNEDPARLAPVAAALSEGPARARAPLVGRMLLGALAAFGPPLARMRIS